MRYPLLGAGCLEFGAASGSQTAGHWRPHCLDRLLKKQPQQPLQALQGDRDRGHTDCDF